MRFWIAILSLASCAMMAFVLYPGGTSAAQSSETDWEKHPYIIKDGKVDYGTYDGYRRYEAYCLRCHGPDAMGSSYAPALKDSLKTLTYEQFLNTVTNGRKVELAGQWSVMPSFAEATDVMLNIDHIYAYLKARANGAIGRGRPQRMPADQDPVYKEWKANQ